MLPGLYLTFQTLHQHLVTAGYDLYVDYLSVDVLSVDALSVHDLSVDDVSVHDLSERRVEYGVVGFKTRGVSAARRFT